jgi:hypothetical protein
VAALTILIILLSRVEVLEQIPSAIWVAALTTTVGGSLGVVLPTGIRAFAGSSTRVTEAWAVNGAFSILGSAVAALGGLAVGSRGLLMGALLCYGTAFLLLASSWSHRGRLLRGRP